MDRLVHKLEFEGPSISFSSRHLAVGVASLDTDAAFNGTTFSAVMAPNASEPQVPSSLLPSQVLMESQFSLLLSESLTLDVLGCCIKGPRCVYSL